MNPNLVENKDRQIHYKIGFIGMGNLAQAIVRGWLEKKIIPANHIYASNRTPGKLAKVSQELGIFTTPTNEEIVDAADILIISTKPQDLREAIEPLISSLRPNQIVISLAAGILLADLEKKAPQARWAKVLTNTPAIIHHGVVGYLVSDEDPGRESLIEDLFSPLGTVFKLEDEEQAEAFVVSCSSGTGFILEFMTYFQDWIEERGIPTDVARRMAVETFLGTSMLAHLSQSVSLEELQTKVVSKKGLTAAGLESMRENDMERYLRISFEKAAMRNREFAKYSY